MELLLFIFAGSAASASSVSVSPTSINFGSVNVGSSAQQQIKITNSTAFGVTITSVTVSGNYFSISGITAPLSLNTGLSATLTVKFAPQAAGLQTGKIVVQGRGFTTALDVTLSANGVASTSGPSVSAVPTSASLGSVPVGSGNSQTFTVTNHGTTTVSVSSESVSGTGFSLSGLADGAQISAGKSSTFNVAFKPAKTGAVSGSASINFSASGKTVPLTVSLSGTGVTATGTLQVSPTAMNFGDVLVGHSGSLALKVTNAGNSALTTSRGTISGSGFSMIGGLSGLTLQPGQSDSVTVVFEPTVTGSASGAISVVAGTTTTSVALSGSGTTGSSSHSVDLSWSASTSSGVAGYYVERATTSGGPYQILNSSKDTGTSYVDSTVQAGKEYFYVVVAVNTSGQESNPSAQVSATIP
jgi:Abnormal spindle-like microcephaly-assoc'd, ASPM-SPD-2-Hydin